MKLAYFHCPTADNDDVALGEAKVLGHVPPTCLLGGVIVWQKVHNGFDPCAGCNGPRERCGGRPKGTDLDRFRHGAVIVATSGAIYDYAEAIRRSRRP